MMESKKPYLVCVCFYGLSLALIILGISGLFSWSFLYNRIIDSKTTLKNNSLAYDIWKEIPFPIHIDFYLFNWTNPEDVYKDDVKMKFTQLGPYRFREVKTKVNVTFNENNGTVSYRQMSKWYFDESSSSNLDDSITTLNPISLTASHRARYWGYLIKRGLSVSLSSQSIHITKSARQFLFDGYKDPILGLGRSLPFLSGLPPWDKFGWFYSRNGSSDYDGTFNMGTGQNPEHKYGQLYEWNHKSSMPYLSEQCNQLDTLAGQLFPRNPSKSKVSIFSSDICRDMPLDYAGESSVSDIIGQKYTMGVTAMGNATFNPGNECNCMGECMPSGVVNVSSCRYGSPAFGSLPHFYGADPVYVNSVEGLNPEKGKHEFYMILEPTTGIPLEVMVRLQINMLLHPIPGISLYQNVKSTMVPVIWFEQKIKLPSDIIFSMKFLLNLPVIFTSTGILCIILGLLLMFFALYKGFTTHLCDKSKDKNLFGEQFEPLKSNYRPQIVKVVTNPESRDNF